MKKVIYTLILATFFICSLALVSSATSAFYVSDDIYELSIMGSSPSSYGDTYFGSDTSGNVPYGTYEYYTNITHYYEYGLDVTISRISNIEAFQLRYSSLTYDDFRQYWMDLYYTLDYGDPLYNIANAYAYEITESEYYYYRDYAIPVSGVSWEEIDLEIKSWYNSLDWQIIENYTINSMTTLRAFLDDNATYNIDVMEERIANLIELNNFKQEEIVALENIRQELLTEIDEVRNLSYTTGYNDGMEESGALKQGIITLVSAPMYIIGNLLDFEVFGISLFSLLTSIITILIIAFVIKKLSN